MRPDPIAVCEEYAAFAKWLAGRYYVRFAKRVEYDDIAQAVRIGLWQAALGYDPDRGTFETYARLCCRRTVGFEAQIVLGRGLVRAGTGKRITEVPPLEPLPNLCSGEEHEWLAARPEPAPPDPDFWRRVRSLLTAGEWEAVSRCYRDGRGHAAAGAGTSRLAVQSATARARAKLRGGLKRD